jgi:hypothetical protein
MEDIGNLSTVKITTSCELLCLHATVAVGKFGQNFIKHLRFQAKPEVPRFWDSKTEGEEVEKIPCSTSQDWRRSSIHIAD